MPMLNVLLVQLPVPNNAATNVPLAAGYLKAYAHAHGLLEQVQIDILPRALADNAGDAMLVDAIVARRPDLLGVSLYTWNSERSLDVAARVKAQLPGLLVVVGGPEVQRDNDWVLCHPAVDVAVIGEGEQTFCEILQSLAENQESQNRRTEEPPLSPGHPATPSPTHPATRPPRHPLTRSPTHPVTHSRGHLVTLSPGHLATIPGLAFRDAAGEPVFTPERAALSDLAPLASPYLLGYLDPGPILMVEISRWCSYACGFCLYGRNMGTKLGSRYFPLQRILEEIAWGRARGATQIHFVEANLNLVPVFRPLMQALADINADGALALYAELRGEHLTDEAVDALWRAGLRVAEVGLQTANPLALQAAHRRTDLRKWAAGTRRLAARGVAVYLDVILGLPADDAGGVAATREFIERERLGPYDVFTLQVLPGTDTRRLVDQYRLVYQDRPPYYILGTDRLSYAELRRLRRELKRGAGLDPDEVEGCPPPRPQITACRTQVEHNALVQQWWLIDADDAAWAAAEHSLNQLATHVDLIIEWGAATGPGLGRLGALLARAIEANPSTLFDCYLLADTPPTPAALRDWRAALPYHPGYLDRVAVYRRDAPAPAHDRVSPRLWLVLPWSAQIDPAAYCGVAEIIWQYQLAPGEEPPFGAWAAAGGAGVWLPGQPAEQLEAWRAAADMLIWG